MKLQWLLETELFEGDCEAFIETLDRFGSKYFELKFGLAYDDCIAQIDANRYTHHGTDRFKKPNLEPIIFHGSLQFAKRIQNQDTSITVFCDLPKYECLYYYPRFGRHLLNSNYVMFPFGEINRRQEWIFEHIGNPVFVRPSSGYKTFTGLTISDKSWNAEMNFLRHHVDPQELVLVAPVVELLREWRCIVVNNKIITACQYKDKEKTVRIKEVPMGVIEYGQSLLDGMEANSNLYQPDPAWTLDICETADNKLKVLEVGSFSCSGFYACDPEIIIKAMEEILS